MNELHFAFQVRQHLNRGTLAMDCTTLDRLAAARQQALARQKVAVSSSVLAGIGSHFQIQFDHLHPRQLLLLAALAVALAFGSLAYWQAQDQVSELEEVDSALLSDDLPISAYLDNGFDAWLNKRSSEE
jgi:hypothetical protein